MVCLLPLITKSQPDLPWVDGRLFTSVGNYSHLGPSLELTLHRAHPHRPVLALSLCGRDPRKRAPGLASHRKGTGAGGRGVGADWQPTRRSTASGRAEAKWTVTAQGRGGCQPAD